MRHAVDQCAFIKANCPDEEAGLLSYLTLYYCTLTNARVFAFTILVAWLGMLFTTIGIAASDFFCVNLSTISHILGMSESMAGVTFLALGNGSPDVFSTFAAMKTHSGSLAVGELIGAAGFITAVVAGSVALVRPFKVAKKSFVRDVSFFIVAASFSMAFLADGSLHLWECAVMVGFYVFYVCTVVAWHWWLKRRRRRRQRSSSLHHSFYMPVNSNEPEEVEGPANADEAHDATLGTRRDSHLRRSSTQFSGLSPRPSSTWGSHVDDDRVPDEDDEEEERERWLADVSENMRLRRRPRGERRGTLNPIRPSLVGALEFRAVLSSVKKTRTLQTIPTQIRRHSDDPNFTTTQQHNQGSSIPRLDSQHPGIGNPASSSRLDPGNEESTSVNRMRAVSVNDVSALRGHRQVFTRSVPEINMCDSPPTLHVDETPTRGRGGPLDAQQTSPRLFISPPASAETSRGSSPAPVSRTDSADLLAPPPKEHGPVHRRTDSSSKSSRRSARSPEMSPLLTGDDLPKLHLPHSPDQGMGHSPRSPFPIYTDSPFPMSAQAGAMPPSIFLPRPSLTEDAFYSQAEPEETAAEPYRWWPYRFLPAPQTLMSTLFPTLYTWKDKNAWERFLALIAAPSVFLLAITLPVVETESEEDEMAGMPAEGGILTPREDGARSRASTMPGPVPGRQPQEHDVDYFTGTNHKGNGAASNGHVDEEGGRQPTEDEPDTPVSSAREWNRWLVALQTITGPLFVVLILWANTTPDSAPSSPLPRMCLYALLSSCVALVVLMLASSSTEPPRWRPFLCFFGFVVSVAWISTIAGEVVGVLKAFGVILGISDAILGLTVFAVGNSLGDLVANMTVARVYPVMALSSCFGGPMLNILLGIGISGLYITITHGNEHRAKHPDNRVRYKPYQIEVSSTLMISGVSLLVTLVGLLIVVPWNGWKMDRKIGWGLIGLWSVSTIGNLVVEVTDLGGKLS